MSLSSFLKLVELPTKVASVFPFLVGTTYALYRYDQFDLVNFLIMLVAMLCLDMATTALNNYMDYKKAVRTHGFNYEEHNAIVRYGLSEKTVKATIGFLVTVAIALGLVLFTRTDWVVLLAGMVCFFFAMIYTWGPFPISRTPLGEMVSGVIMGGFITFISLYIHIVDLGLIGLSYGENILQVQVNLMEFIGIALLATPLVMGIANIMLANNTSDMEDDYENQRYTLPLVIGKDRALKLFAGLYMVGYVAVVVGVVGGWLPWASLLLLGTLIPVRKNLKLFFAKQTKAETFITSVQNFVLISGVYVVTLVIGIFTQ